MEPGRDYPEFEAPRKLAAELRLVAMSGFPGPLFTHVTCDPRWSGRPGLSSAVPLTPFSSLSFSPRLLGQHKPRHVIPSWPGAAAAVSEERPLFPSTARTPRLPLVVHAEFQVRPEEGSTVALPQWAAAVFCLDPTISLPTPKAENKLFHDNWELLFKSKKDLGREWATHGHGHSCPEKGGQPSGVPHAPSDSG